MEMGWEKQKGRGRKESSNGNKSPRSGVIPLPWPLSLHPMPEPSRDVLHVISTSDTSYATL